MGRNRHPLLQAGEAEATRRPRHAEMLAHRDGRINTCTKHMHNEEHMHKEMAPVSVPGYERH